MSSHRIALNKKQISPFLSQPTHTHIPSNKETTLPPCIYKNAYTIQQRPKVSHYGASASSSSRQPKSRVLPLFFLVDVYAHSLPLLLRKERERANTRAQHPHLLGLPRGCVIRLTILHTASACACLCVYTKRASERAQRLIKKEGRAGLIRLPVFQSARVLQLSKRRLRCLCASPTPENSRTRQSGKYVYFAAVADSLFRVSLYRYNDTKWRFGQRATSLFDSSARNYSVYLWRRARICTCGWLGVTPGCETGTEVCNWINSAAAVCELISELVSYFKWAFWNFSRGNLLRFCAPCVLLLDSFYILIAFIYFR